ncbi:MAG: 23S rRNA (adenine(2503)-C2)-methyltransferase, partial [Parachlamydia sp.]|nr:23S rRNA (adenine(2503)-C2)-methyltransferase [Parachlamydia sp.]
MISILSHTSHTFAETIQAHLGKGLHHALLVYKEWCRTGKVTGSNPAFNNASTLFESICALTDFSLLPLSANLTDGKTGKFLLQTEEKLSVESVMIPMQAGGTLCVSSQVGCRMGCAFC